ncbi:hypothetical protein Hanom_Chr07g00667161 [Helianthus anomalus]
MCGFAFIQRTPGETQRGSTNRGIVVKGQSLSFLSWSGWFHWRPKSDKVCV